MLKKTSMPKFGGGGSPVRGGGIAGRLGGGGSTATPKQLGNVMAQYKEAKNSSGVKKVKK